MVRKYDSSKSDPQQKEQCKELRKQKHALERDFGIRGRGDFILRSCLHFAKAVHVYKRILNQKEFGSWERDDFYLSLQDKQKLLESPEIFLNNQQIKRATHIAIKTSVHWDRVSTNVLTIDLNSFGAPCKLEVKVDFHDVQHWGVPELEGQYFEITTSLNAAVPAAYSLPAAAAAYAVNKIQGFVRKKYHRSLGDISGELQDTLQLLDSHIPPTAAGVSAVNLFQMDPASDSLQLLYTRILGHWGHEAGMRAGASGTVAGGWNAHVRDGKNLGEKLGTGTLKYLWRQFSGHFNNNNPDAWNRFVNRQGLFPIKPAIKEIFHNILIEGHPAKRSYDAFMKDIQTHIDRTVNGDKNDFEAKCNRPSTNDNIPPLTILGIAS